MPAQPKALSIYRGQSKSGIGEGPSIPVAHGEQYLEGTAEEFCDDDRLRAIRPWLTLDSDSADHQHLQDRLEGWSCFSHAGWLFIVRLASAGVYDRRAAYFSHARAWPLEQCPEAFDPGVYLGCSQVFDGLEERKGMAEAELDRLHPEDLPKAWLPVLQANPAAATAFLAHLLQALETGHPLLIAAPVTAFTPASDLFVLAAFARAALPGDLKSRCTVRCYTRQPERFARHLGANLILLPEDSAAEALTAQGQATLLDPHGKILKTSKPLEPAALAYAQVAVAGCLNAPQGLLPFSAYLGRQRQRGLFAGENVALLQLCYLLAMGLSGDEADRAEVFRYVMRAQAPDLPWERLLDDTDWARFPKAVLAEFVLVPADALKNTGERELQNVVTGALERLGLSLDGNLEGWWQAADPDKLGRLADLLARSPGLFADSKALAGRTLRIPLHEWQKANTALHGLLKLEMEAETLGMRSAEQESLAGLAKAPDNLAVLEAASLAGRLGTGWAQHFIRQAKAEDSPILTQMARDWLEKPADLARWQGLPLRLVDCLRRLRIPLPADLEDKFTALGLALDPVKHFDVYIRLADLLDPADPNSGALSEHPLMRGLWANLDRLAAREARAKLVAIALSPDWQCLAPASLPKLAAAVSWQEWKDVLAEALLHIVDVWDALGTAKLLDCLREAGPRLDKARIQQVYALITQRWRQDPGKTTAALVQSGAWLGWRRQAGAVLTAQECRSAALAWLACPVWKDGMAPEPCLESWKQALEDVAPVLAGEEIQRLRQGKDRQGAAAWPWISHFQEEQLADIARLAWDLGALAEFAEAVSQSCHYTGNPIEPIREAIAAYQEVRGQDLPKAFNADDLLWLMKPTPPDARPLSLEASSCLFAHSGHRQAQALQARIQSVLEAFETQPLQALEAMEHPNLWLERSFIDPWATWLGSLQASGDFFAHLDLDLLSSPRKLPFVLSTERVAAAERLMKQGYKEIANCLNPSPRGSPSVAYPKPQAETLPGLPGEVLKALLDPRSEDILWKEIAEGIYPAGEHPLIELVNFNDILGFFRDTRRDNTLQEIISKNPGLLKPFSAPNPRLPVFELYACLSGEGGIGNAITRFVRFVYNHHSIYQQDPQWWLALLESIEYRCKNRPDNSAEMARTNLCRAVNNNIEPKSNPEKHRLFLQINQALYRALIDKGFKEKARTLILE